MAYKFDPNDNLHGFYLVRSSALYRTIGHAEFAGQVDEFMRGAAIGLWHGQTISEDHLAAVNCLYSKGQKKPTYLYWELVSAESEFEELKIPDFFRVLVITNRKAAEELLAFVRALMMRICDKRVAIASETEFMARLTGELDAVLNSDDPLGFAASASAAAAGAGAAAGKTEAKSAAPAEKKEDEPPPEKLEDLLAELDSLVGLEQVKKDVRSLINLIKVRKLRADNELRSPELSLHMVFTGNPGTGKTTVARLLSRLYRSIGVLSKGTLVEVDRAGLVAGYVGQTALKTKEAVEKARGGILFVDEAYSLAPENAANDFGQEAIGIILKSMEDMREELVVIAAGYPEPMERFISSNPGLESRFGKYFHFEDYNGEELMKIFESLCAKNQYEPDEEARRFAAELFESMYEDRDDNFGNARDVRNIFERAVANHSDRLAAMEAPTKEELMTFRKEDIAGSGE